MITKHLYGPRRSGVMEQDQTPSLPSWCWWEVCPLYSNPKVAQPRYLAGDSNVFFLMTDEPENYGYILKEISFPERSEER